MAVDDDGSVEESSAEVERVYRAEALKMWRAIVGYAGDPGVADDAVSEAFARALLHRDSIHDLRAWTWRVAFRVAAAEVRTRARHDESWLLDAAEPSADAADLVTALRRLPERQRLALVLHDYADRPTAEVATILGCTQATVLVHLSRGRNGFEGSWRYAMREQMTALDDLNMDDLWGQARTRAPSPEGPEPRHGWRDRSLTYALSAVVLAFIGAVVMTLLPLRDERPPGTLTTPQPGVPLGAKITDTIDIGSTPNSIAAGANGVWVGAPMPRSEKGADAVVRIDPSTDEVAARIPVPSVFGSVSDIAADEAGVWVTTVKRPDRNLVLTTFQIDPVTNSLGAPIRDVGSQLAIAGDTGWALAAGSDETPTALVRIDASTGSIVARTELGGTGTDIVLGGGSVWVPLLTTGKDVRRVVQVDESTGALVRTISMANTSGTFYPPVVASGALWVPTCCVDNEAFLIHIDPSTGDAIGAPAPIADGLPIGSAYGNILLMSERGTLSALDPVSLSIDDLAKSGWPSSPATTVYDASIDAVWVANYRGTVSRIDIRPEPDPE
jgi:RNA polymerase sigma-70 factor (ECF subfamily)